VTIKSSPKGLSNFNVSELILGLGLQYHHPSHCWNQYPTSHAQASQQASWVLVFL
jgi:hypothetical protein